VSSFPCSSLFESRLNGLKAKLLAERAKPPACVREFEEHRRRRNKKAEMEFARKTTLMSMPQIYSCASRTLEVDVQARKSMLPVGIPIERDERSNAVTDKYVEVKCVPLFCAVNKVENARPFS
jgi:hypothetical protein